MKSRKSIVTSRSTTVLFLAIWILPMVIACGGAGSSAPSEVLATRGCQPGNPFGCRIVVAEKAAHTYRDGMTGRDSEAWCLIYQVGDEPPKSSIVYLAETTDGKQWLPALGPKGQLESVGCPQAAAALAQ